MKFASFKAVIGFVIKLNNKFFNTSATLPGGCKVTSLACAKTNVLGNIVLTTTALMDASSIPTAYKIKIGLKLPAPSPTLKLVIDASTKTKTKIGATDFKALINKSPKRLTYGATFGNKYATIKPRMMAIRIRETKLKRARAANMLNLYA